MGGYRAKKSGWTDESGGRWANGALRGEGQLRHAPRGGLNLGALQPPSLDLALGSAGSESAGVPPEAAPSLLPAKRPWPPLLLVCDLASLTASLALGALRAPPPRPREGPTSVAVSLAHEVPYLPLYLVALAGYGLYQHDRRRLRSTSFLDMGALASRPRRSAASSRLATSAVLHRWAQAPRLGWGQVVFMSLPAVALVPAVRATTSLALRTRGVVRSSRRRCRLGVRRQRSDRAAQALPRHRDHGLRR